MLPIRLVLLYSNLYFNHQNVFKKIKINVSLREREREREKQFEGNNVC